MPNMEEIKKGENAIAINVKLQPMNHSDQPVLANFITVEVAQGLAYLDFGFIEPSQLGKAVQSAKNGNGKPVQETVNGKLVMRTAIGLDVLQRLNGQLQEVIRELREMSQTRRKKMSESMRESNSGGSSKETVPI